MDKRSVKGRAIEKGKMKEKVKQEGKNVEKEKSTDLSLDANLQNI